ncbi:transient receptor potential cation channel subfamily a member 1-like [Gigaspora margarita]|uniref:Transient receptor potential cation channel subfamily a member 1-like n=1 Tax=Gigaspora margarita TaxID=4874 RepID=A0A8H4B484_GIGMA|nr:transient receptor potential cation channel subfamily a member 1-like [Gigaspora margarita]
MSSSNSEVSISMDDAQHKGTEINPHEGKEISNYVFSPRMQNIATLSEEDKSIVVWTITEELIVKYDNTLVANDFKNVLNASKFGGSFSDFRFEDIFARHKNTSIDISDYKQIILKLKRHDDFSFDFVLIDTTTKSRQILSAQGLTETIASIAFLKKGDLTIVKGEPVYRAYIFSKSNGKLPWTCKKSFELEKFYFCSIHQNGKLFLFFETPSFLIMQWDLTTQNFDMQYKLYSNQRVTHSRLGNLKTKLNDENTLLAVHWDHFYSCDIYVYSAKSGRIIANKTFDEELHNFCFIGSGKEERLFFSGPHHDKRSYRSYVLNPYNTHTLNKSSDTYVLQDIYPVTYQNYRSIGSIISDFVINIDMNGLSIQRLSQNKEWKNYIERKERYYNSAYTYFNVREIRQFIQDIFEKYKSNQNLTLKYAKRKEYPGNTHTWIIESNEDVYGIWEVKLKARIGSDKEIESRSFYLDTGIFENKILENGDILLVFSSCIQIYAINLEKNSKKPIILIYCWNNNSKQKVGTPKNSIFDLLSSFEKNLNFRYFDFEILPPPNFYICMEARTGVRNVSSIYCYEAYDTSLLFNLQHYGTYVTPHDLFNTSYFNLLYFWISEKWSYFKDSCPQLYSILIFPYSLYSYYSIYPQETVILIFPLLNFATYSKNHSYIELFYLQGNPFTLLLDAPEYYKWWNIKALINFKWNTYGRLYYFIIWAIYSVFMCCFLIVSSIPEHKISWSIQIILLISTVFLGVFHFIWEFRQFIHTPKTYIASPWNYIDLAAILVPTIISILWLHNKFLPIWAITIAVCLLEIKFLLFFRVIEHFGIYFAIMIGVAKKVFSFLVVLGIMVLVFAHSLHLLLRPTSEYSYDQPSFTDDANNPWNLVSTYKFISPNGTVDKSLLIETPDDSTNLFSLFSTSILAVYFMLTGDSSSVSSWVLKNNWTLAFLLFIFSFFTTIYLLNLFISLLGDAIADRNNEESFLQLRGEILSEIELFWMLPYQRRKKNWFPEILYYKASVNELKKYINNLEDKSGVHSEILKIAKIEDSEKELKQKIEDSENELKKKIEDSEMELKNQINEALDKINKLIELTEKNNNNNNSSD